MSLSDRETSPPEPDASTDSPHRHHLPSRVSPQRMLQHRGMVLATLFLVTGALGIPLLWINEQFSLVERIVWSVVLVIYTTAVLIVGAIVILWMYRHTLGAA